MANVKVFVLKPFGAHSLGTTVSVDEKRLPYLLKKKLARPVDSSPESGAAPDDRIEGIASRVEALSGIPRETEESDLDYLDRATEKALDSLEPKGGNDEVEESSTEKSFEDYLREHLPANVVESLVNANILTPDDVVGTSDEDLTKLEGVGKATAEKIRSITDEYALANQD